MVWGMDGKLREVLDVPFKGKAYCYRVTFDDGQSIVASDEHLWIAMTSQSRFRKKTKSGHKRKHYREWSVLTTEEIMIQGKYSPETKHPYYRAATPVARPLETEDTGLFDPYLVGLLLGDGSMTRRRTRIASADKEILDYVPSKYKINNDGRYSYTISGLNEDTLLAGIRNKISYEKFIP